MRAPNLSLSQDGHPSGACSHACGLEGLAAACSTELIGSRQGKPQQRLWLCEHRPVLDLGAEIQLSGLSLAGFWLVQIDAHPGFWAWLGN